MKAKEPLVYSLRVYAVDDIFKACLFKMQNRDPVNDPSINEFFVIFLRDTICHKREFALRIDKRR